MIFSNTLRKFIILSSCALWLLVSTACDKENETITPADNTGSTDGNTNDTDDEGDEGDTYDSLSNLDKLPKDTGGKHTGYPLGKTDANFGHYIYTPGGYGKASVKYPLLIFLHGTSKRGDSQITPTVLDKLLKTGVPRMIENGRWKPKYPLVVVSPQLPKGLWNAKEIHDFIKYIIDHYNIDKTRIYMTGVSLGAIGVFTYIDNKGSEAYPAAAIPIAGHGIYTKNPENFKHTAIWAFHGEKDTVVKPSGSIDMVNAINSHNPSVPAKVTIYPGVTHESWSRTFDGSGMGQESEKYAPFKENIFEWIFRYTKS